MKGAALSAILLLLAAGTAGADQTVFTAGAGSRLVLDGSSNVTDWRCSGTVLQAELIAGAPAENMDVMIGGIEDFRLRVPIDSLRCGNALMERDMNRALNAEMHPTIEFRFTELRSRMQCDTGTNVYRARIAGVLQLAGERRDIELLIVALRIAPGRIRIRGEMLLRMTDFGITPPTALFGVVRARNELVVRFDMMLQASL